jgi:hypothetical protein
MIDVQISALLVLIIWLFPLISRPWMRIPRNHI